MTGSSILILNNDCLSHLVPYIDDPYSFHGIILSCKRLQHVFTSMESHWHSNIRRAKIEFPIKRSLTDIFSCGETCDERMEMWFALDNLFDNAIDYSLKKSLWSYPKLVEIWHNFGAVAAKLFTWIQSLKCTVNVSSRGPKFSSVYWEFKIHLPGCSEDMEIYTRYIHPNDPVDVSIGAHRLGFCLQICHNEAFYEYQGSVDMLPDEYLTWDRRIKKEIFQKMAPMIDLLQRELGKTTSPVSSDFFLWFCLFFIANHTLPEKEKIHFEDRAMNEKPTLESIFPGVCQIAEEKFKCSVSNDIYFCQAGEKSKQLIHTLQILASQADTQLLKDLKEQFKLFASIAKEFFHYCPIPFLKKALPGLFLRTSFEPREDNTNTIIPPEKREFKNAVAFRLKDGNELKVFGKMLFIGNKFHYDCQLDLTFVLPDEKVIELESLHAVDNNQGYSDMFEGKGCWMGHGLLFPKKPFFVEDLTPVTELLQECINYSMQEEEAIPQIYIFTALFFLAVLDCVDVIGLFKDILCVDEPNDLRDELNHVIMKMEIHRAEKQLSLIM